MTLNLIPEKEHELREVNGILLKIHKRRERNKQQQKEHKKKFLEFSCLFSACGQRFGLIEAKEFHCLGVGCDQDIDHLIRHIFRSLRPQIEIFYCGRCTPRFFSSKTVKHVMFFVGWFFLRSSEGCWSGTDFQILQNMSRTQAKICGNLKRNYKV